jgi:hypothetical protein
VPPAARNGKPEKSPDVAHCRQRASGLSTERSEVFFLVAFNRWPESRYGAGVNRSMLNTRAA